MENNNRINFEQLKELALKIIFEEDIEYELDMVINKYVTSSNIDRFEVIANTLTECMNFYDAIIKNHINAEGKLIGDGKWDTYTKFYSSEREPIGVIYNKNYWDDVTRIFSNSKNTDQEKVYDPALIKEFRDKLEHPISEYKSRNGISGVIKGRGLVTWSHIKSVYDKVIFYKSNSGAEKNKSIDSSVTLEVNMFNKMPMSDVRKYFDKLSSKKSKNGLPFLDKEGVDIFIKKAFIGVENIDKLKLNYHKGEKLFLWKLFYEYYIKCTDVNSSVEKSKHSRPKYIKLLTDNFSNFTFDEVISNFNKSSEAKGEWD